MKKQFHTKDGIIERELTQKEVEDLARLGDAEAIRELGWSQYPLKKLELIDEKGEVWELEIDSMGKTKTKKKPK